MSLPFPTNRFGPSFTLGPTQVATIISEATRTVEATAFPTGGSANNSPSFPNNILQQSGLTPGQVIGITVGATAGLVFFIVALVWVWNWRRQRKLDRRQQSLGTVVEGDPEKPDGAANAIVAQNTGETIELPAPRGLHEMPETQQGPAIELPAPVERSELPG
ncbi:hypothetical protein C8034_v006203 [Colletotrichum sidae]|uniref:Uncharacterized protein n=4 Tax=Colletotrichum orbiculare species complex TaxID=2707354 RepID=A0A484FB05_COLOR|nr:hypothetical protein Cob_v011943 [Colletotrichum orbiculare MAFF 240422]TDZ27963.1 hypothetical protein C8035_v008671 [Colletotrichum spinosum]TDZ67763.1 hypothetical protein CTRI78_v002652 [Colletotrichum trifolii]TEA12268.1 hypothetical protein C8034_v006203 [Colletotrichum sidae]